MTEKSTFKEFKKEERKKYPSDEEIMAAVVGKGYQAERNALYTRRNIEEKIKQAWMASRNA